MKNILIVTGSRAEFGMLKLLISKFAKDKYFNFKLVVTGSHLQKKFGTTKNEILNNKISIYKEIKVYPKTDSATSIVESVATGLISFNNFFAKEKIDLLIVLGDRHELLAPVISATFHQIAVAHIGGGDITKGSLDDNIRHSITKMSILHFVSNKHSKDRVIQMGEEPKNVFITGNLGCESINKIKILKKKHIQNKFNINFQNKNILVTFHPITNESENEEKIFKELLDALYFFKDLCIIFTYPNNDAGGEIIIKMIKNFVKNKNNLYAFKSLGFENYISIMKYCDAVIGNSSSGLLEAPSMKTPTINIGDRQHGRIKANSVIDCKLSKNEIINAIKKIYTTKFKKKLKYLKNPYYKSNSSDIILNIIKNTKKPKTVKKNFYIR